MTKPRHRTRTPELAQALLGSVAADALQSAAVLAGLAGIALTHPLAGLAAAAAGGAFLAYRPRKATDPLGRTPEQAAAMRRQFSLTLGSVASTGEPVELGNDDVRQHMLVLGTPGEAKTDYLLGLAENTVAAGSGALFVDAKGDVELWAKLYAMVRRHGREDDLLVLNFMTGNAGLGPQGGSVLSNTLNPFATGSSDNLTQLLVGLYPDRDMEDGAERTGRAIAMLTGLMRFLTWLRDEGRIELHAGTIRDHLNFAAVQGAADPANYPDAPEDVRRALDAYLSGLPGYNPERGPRQPQQALDHHGAVERDLSRVLGTFADVYGHIFRPGRCEVDMRDVVLNRRILLVMLPAMEHSCGELASLGQIVVASLKSMMGAALGNRIEGSWEEIVDNRVTNAPTPFTCVLDEVGHYTVPGLALMAAQARSLGFAMVYASRDVQGLSKVSGIEGASMRANCNTTLVHRGEAPPPGALGPPADALVNPAPETVVFPPGAEGDLYMAFKGTSFLLHARRPEGTARQAPELRANHLVTLAMPGRPAAVPALPEAKDI